MKEKLFLGFYILVIGKSIVWVQIRYDRLGDVWFFCGRLGHNQMRCLLASLVMIVGRNGIEVPLYGPWLRSTTRKVIVS